LRLSKLISKRAAYRVGLVLLALAVLSCWGCSMMIGMPGKSYKGPQEPLTSQELAIREELRRRDYIPILFDFDKPHSRDLTETISTLAHLSRFRGDIRDIKAVVDCSNGMAGVIIHDVFSEVEADITFNRTVANQTDGLFISTDEVYADRDDAFFVVELKVRKNDRLLKDAMRYVMSNFTLHQTTYGKLDLVHGGL